MIGKFLFAACAALMVAGGASVMAAGTPGAKPAQPSTRVANAAVLGQLPFTERADFSAAQRGLIASLPGDRITDAQGNIVWDMASYHAFMGSESAPDTVNPSLWRQERLNNITGLFEVTAGIHQIRGFDLSNMTIVEGDTGLIIIDPLVSMETAAAGLALYHEHVNRKPVVAVIYSHSHVDHYGGVKGVTSDADVQAGRTKIYAPSGFLEHAVSENVYAGTAMSRRALYMYGALLPKSADGQIGTGLGKTTALGTVTLIAPTDPIGAQGQAVEERVIDGVRIEFQLTPGTEAPAEMNLYFPHAKALCMAENATHTMHNVLTIRGAQVRDSREWARYLDQALISYGERTEVVFAQHHWPTWGREDIRTFLADQRDMYQYIHDQTLRLANLGMTPLEIADTLQTLPPGLARKWHARGYYGTLSHNVRAVYQRYMGFYDGNPANLDPLPPEQVARHYVQYMGGSRDILARARVSFENGEYRWVAEVMKHVVFAEPENTAARSLLADALEQMGYQAESGTWRNAMLMGAFELRHGVPSGIGTSASPDTLTAMTIGMYFDYMGIRLDGPIAALLLPEFNINWSFVDQQQTHVMTLRNGTLTHRITAPDPDALLTIYLTRAVLDDIIIGDIAFSEAVNEQLIELEGNATLLTVLMWLQTAFDPLFNVVEP